MNIANIYIRIVDTAATLWVRGVQYIYINLLAPHATEESARRREYILNIILTASIVLLGILGIFLVRSLIRYGAAYNGFPLSFFGLIVLIVLVLLYISRKGYHILAAYILVALYFVSISYGVLLWSYMFPAAIIGYIITILCASILISTRAGFITAFLIGLSMTGINYLQMHNIVPIDTAWLFTPLEMRDPIETAIMFLVILILFWLSNREIAHSLHRAQISEAQLREERNLLEDTVEKRTKEIKKMQGEKINQLYRFAEFGRLSSGLFHDLMNPLQSIVASVGTLDPNKQNNFPQVQASIETAVNTSRRMSAIITAVRKQMKTSSQRYYFSLNQELEEALEILEYRARETGTEITYEAEKEIHSYGNALKFHQIAINLLANAIDACEKVAAERKKVTVYLLQKETSAVFIVSDVGCGITPANREKIFESFFTTKGEERGIGLGLSTTKQIIEEEFQGTISVDSIVDAGTTFTVTIPIHEKEDVTVQEKHHETHTE